MNKDNEYVREDNYDNIDNFPSHSKYNPKLWEDNKALYAAGKKIKIKVRHNGPPWLKDTEWDIEKVCDTIDDLASEIYDIFGHIMKKDDLLEKVVFGQAGYHNPIKNPQNNVFYDGLIFSRISKEFLDILHNPSLDRYYSFICHYYCFPGCPYYVEEII